MCPTEGQDDRLLTVDLDGDTVPDVESDAIDCSTWCFPFAAVDLSFDGRAEILVNEGHTAPPASAVIAVYELVDGRLEPVLFPDETNRFLLVDSWQGYHGAYCKGEGDLFMTWGGQTDESGGVLASITFREYRMDADELRFELQRETPLEAFGDALPPRGYRGYDGLFCGVDVAPLG
jgi:hypothetical protein